jgi:hypothetical protein
LTSLAFSITGVRVERHAAVPTLVFRMRIDEPGDAPVHAILLRCQLQIEPRRRAYEDGERDRLLELFGEPGRWRETLHSLAWAHINVNVPAFTGSVEVDVPVVCTYDFEVTAAKYLQALDAGEVPLLFLFSGTVFLEAGNGYQIQQVPWDKEAGFRMPAAVWRELMDAYFPGCGWIRLRRESLDALQRFKAERALITWDDAIEALIATTGAMP